MITHPAGQHPWSTCITATETVITTDGCPLWETLPGPWKALTEWLARHGIDSRDVMLKATIVRDTVNRQVTFTGFRRVSGTFVMFSSATPEAPSVEELDSGVDLSEYLEGEIRPVTREVQLEAPPMPFTPELRAGSQGVGRADDRGEWRA